MTLSRESSATSTPSAQPCSGSVSDQRLARVVVFGRMPPESAFAELERRTGLCVGRVDVYSDWVDVDRICAHAWDLVLQSHLIDGDEPMVVFVPALNVLAAFVSAALALHRGDAPTWLAHYRLKAEQLDLLDLSCLRRRF
ncbi:MAG: hypothetical protein RML84_09120 [Anaerolineae bacterium]|nr:hypothetical protein [Anaerolineae bacterium]